MKNSESEEATSEDGLLETPSHTFVFNVVVSLYTITRGLLR